MRAKSTAVVVTLMLLGCAGLGGRDVSDGAAVDAPADEADESAEDDDEAEGDGKVLVFALHPGGSGCAWKVWRPAGNAQEVGTSPACPSQILWNPDGTEVVYTTADGTFVAPWRRKGVARQVKPPSWPTDGWMSPWIAADTSRLRMVAMVAAQVVERGGGVLFEAGELSIPVVRDGEGWVTYGVKGTEVVAPGAGDRDVSLPSWGSDQIAVFVERGDDGEWTQLAALPTRGEAGDTPGTSVGGALERTADWLSLSGMDLACGNGQDCASETLGDRADLQRLLGAEGPDEVGFLAGDPGGALFKVAWGDTPHAVPPVFGCPDAACTASVALEGLDGEDQLTVQPRGKYVLVAREYGGASPRVYVQGQAKPVLALADAERAGWVPEVGLPRLGGRKDPGR